MTQRKGSRLAFGGVLALAICLAVGLASGGVAAAKKGKKKGGKGGTITVSKTTPTLIPPSIAPSPPPPATPTTPGVRSMVSIPLTVGKKAKGKVVSFDSLVLTYSLTGTAATATDPASASNLGIAITAPNGRDTGVVNPGGGDPNATTIGPVIATPDSPFGTCSTALTAPAPSTTVCDPADVQDPEGTIKPPTYAGVIGDDSLQIFGGVPARGTWTVKVRNFSTVTTGTLSNVSLTMGLIQAPSRK